ncbi:hypothetical protein IU414_18330 [Nocardia farcinica]|uniref:hypothetical protein n=1 Tax=Nocardia farcinica TaxID=37329 RepID=UPI001892FBD5|nr:hypothetical protein [Nocardia farcinica]MBF6253913.1 hypothetical protein [Nocardia farcinica]MBF6265452.1 hypothetical protein [Nocardia farcinica]MBF6284052.1 hypothetical protein [Nocardia farcinica]MBF6308084.1 hypothetical protein [Nocardia farcinica]MBF6511669.1 hypothetical protein [Nocardia farcinica]
MPLTTREFREKTPLAGVRRPYLIGAAAAAALVLVTGIPLIGRDSGSGGQDLATAPGTSSSAAAVPTTPAKGSLVPQVPVNRSPADPDWLTAAPQGVSWQRVEGVPLPFSASDGPSRIDGAVAAGYSHTPQGAAIAALQISMRILYSPDYARILDAQAAISDGDRQQILTARSTQPRLDPVAVQASTVQPAGFKIGAYTGDAATVYYAYPRPSGSYRIARQAVVWRDGDWRYSSDLIAPALPETADLTGFTPL